MATYLHYHSWDLANERISRMKNQIDKFDKIARKNPFPPEVIGSTIWGITKNKGEWYFTGKFVPTWVGHREQIPADVSRIQLFGKEQYATCSEESAVCEHGIYGPIDGLGDITIPKFEMTLDEVAEISQRLSGFFQKINVEIDFDDWEV